MFNHTCDVSVIYSYSINGVNKKFVEKYLLDIKNSNFVYLRAVRETFSSTFSNKIKSICDAVISATNKTLEEIQKRSQNSPPITPRIEKTLFEKNFEDAIKESKEFTYSDDVINYKKLLESKTKIDFDILKEPSELEKFRDDSILTADKITLEKWDAFRKNLKNFKETPRFSLSKLAKWEKEINTLKSKTSIFKDIDNEDIFVAAEYFTYIDEINKTLIFSCLDRNLTESINKCKKELKLVFPNAIFIKENHTY